MKKVIISLILIFLLIGTISFAVETGAVYLQSNYEVVEKGQEVEITVNLKDNEVAAFDFLLYFDNTKWEYVSTLENVNIEDDHILYTWYDRTGGKTPKQGELVKFQFKAKEEGMTTFTINGQFYNSDGQLIQTEFEEEQVQIGREDKLQSQMMENEGQQTEEANTNKSNSYLQTLRIDREGLSPTFDKNIYEYYLTISNEVNEVEVLAISENSNATIDISGNTNLKEGLNTIKIKVISEDKKETKTYSIQITKTADISLANTNLEILAIEDTLLNPPFDANETQYTAEISKEIENLNVFAVAENEKARVNISGDKNLKEGNNTIEIVVTAADGFSKKKYVIEVHKRSQEEQAKYEEEQQSQNEKVEQAYEIEKTGGEDVRQESRDSKENDENGKRKSMNILAIVITAVVLAIVAGILWLKHKN